MDMNWGQVKDGCRRWQMWLWGAALAAGSVYLWKPSSGVAEAAAWAVGVYGVLQGRRLLAHWRNPAGVCFALGVCWAVLSAFWAPNAGGATRDLVKSAALVASVAGLPVLLEGRRRMGGALVAGAGMVSVRLVADLVRLVGALGWGEVWARARYWHPYLYNHPNVSCMMAGVSALILTVAAVRCAMGVRGWRLAAAEGALGAGLCVDVLYLLVMGSRGPQIVFAVAALGLMLWMVPPSWKWRLGAGVVAVAAALGLWAAAGVINPRLEDATMSNLHGRDVVWKYVGERMPEHPWRGFGFGKRTFEAVAYADSTHAPLGGKVHYPHAHSYWLMLVFQGGVIGAALWAAAWMALGRGLFRALGEGSGVVGAGRCVAARAWPAMFLAGIGMILLYGVADYPDNLLRDVQFYLAALGMAWAWPLAESGTASARKSEAAA